MAAPSDASHFLKQVKGCLTDPPFADFTIRSNGREHKVNRHLVACHSNYFKTLFATTFKESNQACVDLQGDHSVSIARMMDYFYTFDYGDNGTTLFEHVDMYILADKYEIPDLRTLAVRKSRSTGTAGPPGEEHDIIPLLKFIYQNTTSAHSDLRLAARDLWLTGDRVPTSEEEKGLLTKRLSGVPEFAAELAMAYAASYSASFNDARHIQCLCGADIIKSLDEDIGTKQCAQCNSKKRRKGEFVVMKGSYKMELRGVRLD